MERTMATWPPLLAGAAEGTVATVAMSGLMVAARRAGWTGELPPRRITRFALRRAGAPPRTPETDDALGTLTHLGFGAAAGALFEAAYQRLGGRGRGRGPLAGAAFGAAVWLVSYAGWVPALGILPPPARDRPGRQGVMLAAHLVYGAVLGALADRRARAVRARRAAEEAWLAAGI